MRGISCVCEHLRNTKQSTDHRRSFVSGVLRRIPQDDTKRKSGRKKGVILRNHDGAALPRRSVTKDLSRSVWFSCRITVSDRGTSIRSQAVPPSPSWGRLIRCGPQCGPYGGICSVSAREYRAAELQAIEGDPSSAAFCAAFLRMTP